MGIGLTDSVEFRSSMGVDLIESMGDDLAVARAAWVSTQGEYSEGEQDETRVRGLINYLVSQRHGSPVEHVVFKFRISCPIFVAREFMRHRMSSYNEWSGRYSQLEPVFYVPSSDRNLVQVGKTGHYEFVEGDEVQKLLVQQSIQRVSVDAYLTYQSMLSAGVAKEVARMVLPVNIYTHFYVTMNARALMNFLSLRTIADNSSYPSYPQREIEMVAEQMEEYFKDTAPILYDAWNNNGRVAP